MTQNLPTAREGSQGPPTTRDHPQTPPTTRDIQRLRAVAGGEAPADVAVRGGRVMHVHTGEVEPADVLIAGRHIAAVTPPGRLSAAADVDASGKVVAPTFIDAHLHVEVTLLPPGELARISVPRGTTAVFGDPNCMANVAGSRGMDWIGSTSSPLRMFEQTSSDTPRRGGYQRGGATVTQADTLARLGRSATVSLGESNPYLLDEEMAEAMAATLAAGRRITGHTARLDGEPLWAYAAGGVGDDHNAATHEEVMERLRLGMIVTIQSSSMSDYTAGILAHASTREVIADWACFCADDKHVEDLVEEGHIDHHVRSAVAAGVDPVAAVRMASLNAASHFRVDHLIGSITPTRLADFQLLEDLESFRPTSVWVGGAEVARDGSALFENRDVVPAWARDTVHPGDRLDASSFRAAAPGSDGHADVRAMEMYDGYYKRAFTARLPVEDGAVVPDPAVDVAKVAVIDRHHGTGEVGVGFVRGFGLRKGALAATTNCDNQNIVAVATSDNDLLAAVRALESVGGGYVVVEEGEPVARLPLPIAGIMSDQPYETALIQSREVNEAARRLGCEIHAPFMILAFVGLPAVPDYGLTELGLIDVDSQDFIDVVMAT